ncbi:MAG TPA: hypothetical protein VGG99_02480 [Acetobacteraceae bacterium]
MSDNRDGIADGDRRLEQIATRLRSGEAGPQTTVRELLRWFGAEYRGVRVNRAIRDALFANDIHIEPDLNATTIDGVLGFSDGRLIDALEEEFFKTEGNLKPGQRLSKIAADMLNKILHELIADNLAAWIDRNPTVTQKEIQAKADTLSGLGLDELEREEGIILLAFPPPGFRIGRENRETRPDFQPGAGATEEASWFLTVHYSRRRMTPGEMMEERRDRERLYMAIGRFMFEFSQLEFYIRYALKSALGLNDEQFSVLATSYDFASLCKSTREFFRRFVEHTRHNQKEVDDLFKECLSINESRVQIAHGTWFVDAVGLGTQHVARGSFAPKILYKKTHELDQITEKIMSLQCRIMRLLIWPFR